MPLIRKLAVLSFHRVEATSSRADHSIQNLIAQIYVKIIQVSLLLRVTKCPQHAHLFPWMSRPTSWRIRCLHQLKSLFIILTNSSASYERKIDSEKDQEASICNRQLSQPSLFIGSVSGAISNWKRYGTMKPSTGVSWAEHIHIFYFWIPVERWWLLKHLHCAQYAMPSEMI